MATAAPPLRRAAAGKTLERGLVRCQEGRDLGGNVRRQSRKGRLLLEKPQDRFGENVVIVGESDDDSVPVKDVPGRIPDSAVLRRQLRNGEGCEDQRYEPQTGTERAWGRAIIQARDSSISKFVRTRSFWGFSSSARRQRRRATSWSPSWCAIVPRRK